MMKIVVDEMPDCPSKCPYSVYHDARSYEWYSCSKQNIVCEIGREDWKCPIFIGLYDIMMKG